MTHSSIESGSSTNVPAFLTKLWKLVEDPNYDHLIHWSQNGKSFIISNQAQFAKELLPLYFKHNNMASFIRQLNMYGFRKLTSIENSGLRAERDDIEFYHLHFVKDKEASLELIKRKIKTPLQVSATKSIDENEVRHDDVGSILVDVKAIKGKQDTVDNILVNMQKENEALWREIAILRQKYQKQQHIVEKLLQFLLSLVHQRGIGVKRKSPLMIGLDEAGDTSSESNKAKRSKEPGATTIDTLENFCPTILDVSDHILEAELEATANTNPIIATAELSPLAIHNPESPANQIDTIDTMGAFLDPIQTAMNESMLSDNDNLNDTNLTKVDQLTNSDTIFIDPSAVTIKFNNDAMDFLAPAIQQVLKSSLNTPNPSETINSLDLSTSNSTSSGSLITPTATSTTPTLLDGTNIQLSLDSTDDNMITLSGMLNPLQPESSFIQPMSSSSPTLSSSTLTIPTIKTTTSSSLSSSPSLTSTTSTNNYAGNSNDLVKADLIQSMTSIENDDGNTDPLLEDPTLDSLMNASFDFDLNFDP